VKDFVEEQGKCHDARQSQTAALGEIVEGADDALTQFDSTRAVHVSTAEPYPGCREHIGNVGVPIFATERSDFPDQRSPVAASSPYKGTKLRYTTKDDRQWLGLSANPIESECEGDVLQGGLETIQEVFDGRAHVLYPGFFGYRHE
jgi:hypothetical protein